MNSDMLLNFLFLAAEAPQIAPRTDIKPVPFTEVKLRDGFWDQRLKLNRDVTIWHEIKMCEETKRIDNFRAAAGEAGYKHEGYLFNDSDVYKVIEAAGYLLSTEKDPKLEAKMDEWIALIAKAQEPDGYLHTQVSASRFGAKPMSRWAEDFGEHELYNVGHLYEAAIAYHQATGKDRLLKTAIKNADLVCKTFNLKAKRHAPGHEEIELALVKLSAHTKHRRYLDQAKFFLDERGSTEGRAITYGEYSQDHLPVLQQDHAVGHSVRAAYLYCGMIDVGKETGDKRYVEATKRIWDDVIKSKIYLTGGIGSSGSNEGFAKEYELPNLTGYAETCASIANILWNQRLFEATGDSKYIDVLERSLYNAFLSGYGADGKSFFYPNPLQSIHGADRQPWFACACCPPNVARLLPKVPELMYATDREGVYVNLYATNDANVEVAGQRIQLRQQGNVVTKGRGSLTIAGGKPESMTIRMRVPGWARNNPFPGSLYEQDGANKANVTFKLNGEEARPKMENGYAIFKRKWQKGDKIDFEFPVFPLFIKSSPLLSENGGLIAIQKGPFVYCAEGVDQAEGTVLDKFVPADSPRTISHGQIRGANPPKLSLRVASSVRDEQGAAVSSGKVTELTMIPYYAWANRGRSQMTVWIPLSPAKTMPKPAATIAALSRLTASEGARDLGAINDQLLPKASVDQSVPNQHWWPKKGSAEWVDFAFDGLRDISSLKVYWFDDTGVGECRVPASWRIMVQVDGQWRPAETQDGYEVAKDNFNTVHFKQVRASNLRMEIQMQPGWSAGIHEVVIE